jgi:hypothetical protein
VPDEGKEATESEERGGDAATERDHACRRGAEQEEDTQRERESREERNVDHRY